MDEVNKVNDSIRRHGSLVDRLKSFVNIEEQVSFLDGLERTQKIFSNECNPLLAAAYNGETTIHGWYQKALKELDSVSNIRDVPEESRSQIFYLEALIGLFPAEYQSRSTRITSHPLMAASGITALSLGESLLSNRSNKRKFLQTAAGITCGFLVGGFYNCYFELQLRKLEENAKFLDNVIDYKMGREHEYDKSNPIARRAFLINLAGYIPTGHTI